MRSVFFLLCNFLILKSECFCQTYSVVNIDEDALKRYALSTSNSILLKIGSEILTKNIKVFSDAILEKPLHEYKMHSLNWHCETIEHSVGDDAIDSTICISLDQPSVWRMLRNINSISDTSLSDVKSIGIYYYWIGTIGYKIVDSSYCFISPNDLVKRLSESERRLLKEYLFSSNNRIQPSILISDSLLEQFIISWFHNFSKPLFNMYLNKSFEVYSTDSLNRKLNLDEIEKRATECITIALDQLIHPGLDSVHCYPFNSDSLIGFGASIIWNLTENGPQSKLNAISLLQKWYINGIYILPHAMFWGNSDDIKNSIQRSDWLFLTDILNFTILDRIERKD